MYLNNANTYLLTILKTTMIYITILVDATKILYSLKKIVNLIQ